MSVELDEARAALKAAVELLNDAPVIAGQVCISPGAGFGWLATHARAINAATCDRCPADGKPCRVGAGTDDAHHRCGTTACPQSGNRP